MLRVRKQGDWQIETVRESEKPRKIYSLIDFVYCIDDGDCIITCLKSLKDSHCWGREIPNALAIAIFLVI